MISKDSWLRLIIFRNVKDGLLAQLTSNEDETVNVTSIVEEGMVLKVGSGDSTLFWHDNWCDVYFPKQTFWVVS